MNPLDPHPFDDEAPGGMVINPHSALGKELRKWEQHKTELVPRGTSPGNPYVYRPYPKMLYKAQRTGQGKVLCLMPPPDPYAFEKPDLYERAVLAMESFNRSCWRLAPDEASERLLQGQGWAESPTHAMARFEQEEQAVGNAAAEAAFYAKRMSAKAQEELNTVAQETHQHVADVTGASKKTRGRPKKAQAVVAVAEE